MNLPSGKSADVLAWAMAASPALGCSEDEMRQALTPPPPPHPMVEVVRALIEQRRQWTGTATELLELLQPLVPCQTPKGVSQQLKNCTRALASNADPGRHWYRIEIPSLTREQADHRAPRGGRGCIFSTKRERCPPISSPLRNPQKQGSL